MAALRVVLDTNALLSGIAYPDSIPGKILTAWRRGSVEVLLSDYILEELRRVLPKLAHRHGLSTIDIDDLVDTLSIQAEVIEPAEPEGIVLRDIDDRPVSGTLLAATAQQWSGLPDYWRQGSAGRGTALPDYQSRRFLGRTWQCRNGSHRRLAPQHASFDTFTRRRHYRAEGL